MASQSSQTLQTPQTSKKKYSLQEKTVSACIQCQTLKEFEYKINKADQADRKACYDAIQHLKKMLE